MCGLENEVQFVINLGGKAAQHLYIKQGSAAAHPRTGLAGGQAMCDVGTGTSQHGCTTQVHSCLASVEHRSFNFDI